VIGTKLGPYEITAKLGEGGMGEVWRATDARLKREVAIKVLPAAFVEDRERLARFEREAQLLAQLNHPNIAHIYGMEASGESHALVMELVEGPTLAERLEQGALPVDESLSFARQIAEALEEAHEKGIVHRDLKPHNIKASREGKVKVLDFGLAKAMDPAGAGSGTSTPSQLAQSPTLTLGATVQGVILGTAAYMAPEQARGVGVDKRADIWAFGVVLFEMLTGRRLFEGELVTDVLANVLKGEIDFGLLPAETPPALRRLLRRCLERHPRRRLRDIGEATIALEEAAAGEEPGERPADPAVSAKRAPARLAWGVAAVAVLALASVLLLGRDEKPALRVGLAVRTQPIPNASMRNRRGPTIAISPDGQTLAFVAREKASGEEKAGRSAGAARGDLWLRRAGDLVATPIAGTEGARAPFFSPDGEWIGFFAPKALMKVAVSGGSPMTLCELVGGDTRGGTWGSGGLIVFAPEWESGLVKVSADGGEPQPVTELDRASGERSHRWPQFLPDGRSVLYMAQIRGKRYDESLVQVVDIASGKAKRIAEGGAYPRYLPSGNLAWTKGNNLLVAAFDLARLEVVGSPRPAVEKVMSSVEREAGDDGSVQMAFSATGVLVYRTEESESAGSHLALVDRSGKVVARGSRNDTYSGVSLSPDGTRVAAVGSDGEVWVWDSSRDTTSRLTFEGQTNSPVWLPDGGSIVYVTTESGKRTLKIRSADGSGTPRDLTQFAQQVGPTSWSPDAHTLFATRVERSFDVIAIPVSGGEAGEPVDVVATPAFELWAKVSPDGRWLAYMSNESGEMQVFVRDLSEPGGRWQVSEGAGFNGNWTRGGREIVYRDSSSDRASSRQFFAVDVDTTAGAPKFGRSRPLLENAELDLDRVTGWDAGTTIDRFAFVVLDDEAVEESSSVVIVTDWFERLKSLEPGKAR